jgi:ribonucleoside-diphosphate reductase alpha chain
MNYDGIAARALGGRIMKTISEAADEESAALARKFGTYPACTPQYMRDIPMRNAVRTTIAPTGTISILAGVSWGIEPISSYSYLRKNCAGMEFMVGHPILEERLEECGLHKDTIARLMDRCYEKGSLQNIDIALPRSILDVFVTATDIAAIDHIKMQAVFQEHTDNAISKTIICPEETTREQIADIVYNAWDRGCKGLTVYRNNSRSDVVVNLKKPAITDTDIKVSRSTDTPVADTHVAKSSDSVGNIEHSHRRPRKLYGCTYKIHSGCGNLYVVTNLGVDGKVRESFVFTGGNGGCASLNEALGRSTSQGLWNGVDVDNYVRQFCKVKCAAAIKNPKAEGKSCADIMGKCLAETHKDDLLRQFALGELSPDSEFYKRMNLQKMVPLTALHSPESNKPRCIECDSPVVQTGQCYTCQSCGFSKCG